MANAVYDNLAIEVESSGYLFKANASTMKFAGYTAVYEEATDDEQKQAENLLPDLQEGEALLLDKTVPEQQFTQPPARYTEATLIRAMEEKGIGRPSTYAPTISTITGHDYVMKEGKYLKPTPLGEVVTSLMKDHFSDIVDLKFTNHMEARLDEIESGKSGWQDVLQEFYEDFDAEMKAAETAMDGQRKGPLWPVPRLQRLPRVHVYQAHRGGDARQVPEVRRPDPEAHLEEGLCLLCLRARHRLRLHHLGRADQGCLPPVRKDHVQAERARTAQGLLHQRGMPGVCPGG